MKSPRGSVLILSLWTLTLLTSLTVTQAGTVGAAWRLTERMQDTLDALDLAQQGLTQALTTLDADSTRAWDAPSEPWGHRQEQTTPAGAWTILVTDDAGLLNVNTCSRETLARLPESSPALASAIIDQRTQHPFHHAAELALLSGMTPERLRSWAPLMTVVGKGPVNLNSVSTEVLEVLGVPASAAATIVAWRNGPDGQLGTADDHVFHDVADIAPVSSALLKPDEAVTLMNLVNTGQLGVRSNAYRIIAQGRSIGRSQTRRTCVALVERQAPGLPSTIRGWHEA